ncbi:MAG: GTPase [Isosphaeraceae bacterium]
MIHLDPQDTIAATASPPGSGLRGLVRLSGPSAWEIALVGFTPDRPEEPSPRRPTWLDGRLAVEGLRPLLPASIALWPGPRTYTGQPLAEVHTVGSPPLLNLVLAGCLTRGARHAEPGEFTLRAFLSGRIDLTRAEAVLGVIDAANPAALDAALEQLAGGLASPIARLRDRFLDVLAHLEAGLDFVDEADVDPLGRAALAFELAQGADEIASLADRLQGRDRPEGLPRVVLVGPPNAGKSRLFNALLGGPHALVSSQAGTTRDYLSAPCDCDGLCVVLIDTAGMESDDGDIKGQAQALRALQAARADLLIDCQPADSGPSPDLPYDRPRLSIITKSDLAPERADLPRTSASTGDGLPALRVLIAEALRAQLSEGDAPASTSARCRDRLHRASTALRDAHETLMLGGGDELVSLDLRQAVDDLGHVIGAVVTDDVLDRIFQRFCIGK